MDENDIQTGPEFDLTGLVEPAEAPEAPVAVAPAPNEITDEMRSRILAEAIQNGDMVPASMLDRMQQPAPVQQTAYQPDPEDPLNPDNYEYEGEKKMVAAFNARLAAIERATMDRFGELAPVVAENARATFIQGVPAEATQYAQEIARDLGGNVARLTPEQRLTLQHAAIGKAYAEGKLGGKAGGSYTPEPVTGSAGSTIAYLPGKGPSDVRAMAELYGRPLTNSELKDLGISR